MKHLQGIYGTDPTTQTASVADIEALVRAEHGDPFALLGPHAVKAGDVRDGAAPQHGHGRSPAQVLPWLGALVLKPEGR